MSNQIAKGLAGIVAKAAASLPADTGAVAKAAARRARGEGRVVLADVSGSMAERAGHRAKIDILREALSGLPAGVRIVAFSSRADEIPVGGALPPPGGSTALHLALDRAAALDATHVLVVSDGHPDNEGQALAAADRLDARIDVIYCGPDSDREGVAFMRRLARGGGSAHHHSMTREPERLAAAVRLALPAR